MLRPPPYSSESESLSSFFEATSCLEILIFYSFDIMGSFCSSSGSVSGVAADISLAFATATLAESAQLPVAQNSPVLVWNALYLLPQKTRSIKMLPYISFIESRFFFVSLRRMWLGTTILQGAEIVCKAFFCASCPCLLLPHP